MTQRTLSGFDRALVEIERALGAIFDPAPAAVRPSPAEDVIEAPLDDTERRHAAGLMRVNHVGEVCAQALYSAQALATTDLALRRQFERAAGEETDHLAWTAERLSELGARPSLLNPLWYAGSFAVGAAAALWGDRASLGFVAETERQVERHLDGHLGRLPAADVRSRAILEAMRAEEIAHGATATAAGGVSLPEPVRTLMHYSARVMTGTAYWV